MQEIYKDIPEYEGLYQVSNLWNIKSLNYRNSWYDRICKNTVRKSGYVQICLTKNKKEQSVFTHRLVTQAFLWELPKWLEVNHKNGIKSDNRLENLEYCTRSDNQLHAINVLGHRSWLARTNPQKWKFWKNNHNSIKISQHNTLWDKINIYASIADASRELWLSIPAIVMALKGKHKTSGWFIWKYV